ncbi:carboxypeptidase regulatory-like domain-containing protein [Alloacidobacterium dinghuense]|uniref:Carboxypeptidase regulatory-like domain-containing protein n=1 Tax=Alloacidobacterium dinghuense TaxID=2763107 RepID=A0A7G8BND1_9BACT|nr:TonB-dependent receptor [Alloacidobacterium dinghuense]QNI34051.1 carboxypeptidase regulatory-like domain-containing protein [Alloacidobacterium dinghuense]
MNSLRMKLAGLIAILFLSAGSGLAQVDTGTVGGTVNDSSGAVVAGATVTFRSLQTDVRRTVDSSANGTYTVTGLSTGTYEVTVNAAGFQPYSSKVEVTVGGHATVDATLSVSSATTQVEVIGEGGTQVNTQTQELSQVVSQEQVSQLPSLTRNPYDFVALSGNISNGDSSNSGNSQMGGNTQNATTRGVNYNINGQRSSGTEILLDGVENVSVFGDSVGIVVPIDAVNEFRVTTSNFEPQYGRASGGVVNVATKAGSNSFHGNVWEFNRIAAYTSNTETNDQINSAFIAGGGTGPLPAPKGQYTRNQFGFAVGGPILKDKLFFFGSTEWIRVRSAATLNAAVPTPQFLGLAAPNIQSFFSTYGGGKTFNFAQTYTADQVGITGLPGNTPALGTVTFSAPTNAGGGFPQNAYNVVGRFDYNLSDKTQIFFRYVDYNEVDQSGSQFASPYNQYNVGQTFENQAYLLSGSHVFNPSLLTNTKLSFSRFNTFFSYDNALQNVPTLIVSVNAQVPGTSTFIQLPGFYNFNPANGGLPFGGPQNTIQWNQDLNWTKGKHTMQYGGQILYIQSNQAYGAYAQANEQLGNNRAVGLQNLFTGNLFEFQAAVNPNGALPCVRNQYTGDLIQTSSCSINLPATSPVFARSNRFHDWAVYAQDAFRITPKFTFNYGVRYEYYGVQHNNHQNLDSNFYYGTLTPSNIRSTGQVYTTPNSPIHSLWNPQYGTVSPRIGFAYDLFGDGRTSIRGGYGISYERNFGNVTFNVIQNPPNYAVVIVNNTVVTNSNAGPLAGSSGNVPLPPTSLRNVDQNIRTAQTQFYSLAVEHQLAAGTVVGLQYAGARGLHLYDIKNINGVGGGNVLLGDTVLDPAGTGNFAATRLNPQYSNINNRGSSGDSYYHALNVQFQTTNFHRTGLGLVANYTFGHATDDLSTTFSETNNAFSLGYTNPFNPALDRGNGDLDLRQRLVIAPIYQAPMLAHSNALLRETLGGWQVTGIYTVRSGTPFTYFDSTNNFSGYNIGRYTPAGGTVPQSLFKSIPHGVDGGGANTYTVGTLPAANSWANPLFAPVDPADYPNGFSDWGPWPATMTARNAFRGPGAWNLDASVQKTFPITERFNLVFRAEGFDVFNHHNLYIQEGLNDIGNHNGGTIIASKGGIGNNGGANDERRFGQFSLAVKF